MAQPGGDPKETLGSRIDTAGNCRLQPTYRKALFEMSQALCRDVSPTRTLKWPGRNRVQIRCNISGVSHVEYVACEGIAQLLHLKELKSHLF